MAGRTRTRKRPERATAQRTREQLLRAGRKVFAAKGLGGASLREDILRKAGVSTGSFYHQFHDKADLLVEILRCDGQAIVDAFAAPPEGGGGGGGEGGDPIARGRRLLEQLFRMTDAHPEFVKIFVREYYSDSRAVRREIRQHTERLIARLRVYYAGLAEATGLPLDADGIARLLAIQAFAMINYYLDFPKKERDALRERFVTQMLQLSTGGVLAVRRLEGEAAAAQATRVEPAAADDDATR